MAERLTKEQIEEAKRRLKEEGYEVVEIKPYDKNDPSTDRRKAKDRRKPAERGGLFGR